MSIPKEQKALVIEEGQILKLKLIPVPALKTDVDILIKTEAIAQNPTDWKHLKFKLAGPGKVVGCDLAGVVVQAKDKSLIGKRVPKSKIPANLKVAACVHGGWEDGNGAYAQYVNVDKGMTIALPDKISFEEGSTLPLASITAALVIFQQLGFPFPGQGKKEVPFLVWGGASSVGMYAIQFAHLAGASVIAVASKSNHGLLKSLGASHTFDYKDPDVIDQIKKASAGGVEYGIDTISEAKTVAQCSKAYKSNGQIGLILPVDKSQSGDSLTHNNVLMYTIFNHDFKFGPQNFPANPTDHKFAIKAYKLVAELLAQGKFTANPVRKYPKGLASVEQGFADAEAGNIRAQKAVYVVSDTPGL